ncbi:hypothetical protein PISMIDRAFT_479459 [Pisolithus microcarpus 441]|uniref:Uncharacterized protein n=1 Tax=Pisolithus microcarpus 441 TaxID=765257 RepID=A0A0C9ZJ70_9AGAM|nr:hypothetical protein PISMIDRAFT_479459 [Pisolithus microcarpus 441]
MSWPTLLFARETEKTSRSVRGFLLMADTINHYYDHSNSVIPSHYVVETLIPVLDMFIDREYVVGCPLISSISKSKKCWQVIEICPCQNPLSKSARNVAITSHQRRMYEEGQQRSIAPA